MDAQKNADEAKETAALAVSHRDAKAKAKAKGRNNGKANSSRATLKCTNCKRTGHEKADCYAEGGGKANKAPDWWKKGVESAKGKKQAHAAQKEASDDEDCSFIVDAGNVAFTAALEDEFLDPEFDVSFLDDSSPLPDDEALAVTSDFRDMDKAHNAADIQQHGIVIDTSASRRFTPDCNQLINFTPIELSPIRAADWHTFNALGKGNMQIF